MNFEIREEPPLEADVVVRDPDWTVASVHRELFETESMREHLVEAIRELADGQTASEFDATLEAIGVDALDGIYRDVCVDVARGDRDALFDLVRYTRQLGSGGTSAGPGITSPTEDTRAGPLPILEAADVEPSVAIILDERFTDPDETRADHRESVLSLLVAFADAADVAIVPTGQIERSFLWRKHRDLLPGSVEAQCNPHRAGRLAKSYVEERIADARERLDPDSTPVQYLRKLAETGSKTLTYSDFEREFRRARETIRTHITQTLVPLELVDVVDWSGEPAASLTHIGEQYLEVLDETVGRQIGLEESVDSTPKTPYRPCNPAHGMAGEARAGPYTTTFLPRFEHAGAAACATSGDVTLVSAPVDHAEWGDDDHTRYVSYDAGRDEAVVAVRATGPLQYAVSLAAALASPLLLDQALPTDRIQSILDDDEIDPFLLRNKRCIGSLPDEALEDPEELRDELVDWGILLEDLTTDLRHGEYDDRDDFRSAIMRSAHGLAGSIVHLLDVAGVDIVRELRIPNTPSDEKLAKLSKTIAKAAAIQSRYDDYAAYRQLFEERDRKRQQSGTVTVNADDPYGTHIGGLVVRGKGVDRLRPHLESRLSGDDDLVEDAPEFGINLTVRAATRADVATAASRILSKSNLSLTREAASILHGIAATPHAAARAVHYLGEEDRPRSIRPDEVRYGLLHLDPDQLVPDLSPSARKIVAALLEATEPLSQSELAALADVSTQSIRNHRDTLEAVGLLEITDDGYRLTLSTRDERSEAIVPPTVDQSLLDAVDSLLESYLLPSRYADPEDPLGKALWDPPNPWLLEDHPDLGGPFAIAVRLTDNQPEAESTVTMGHSSIAQQPLPTSEVSA